MAEGVAAAVGGTAVSAGVSAAIAGDAATVAAGKPEVGVQAIRKISGMSRRLRMAKGEVHSRKDRALAGSMAGLGVVLDIVSPDGDERGLGGSFRRPAGSRQETRATTTP